MDHPIRVLVAKPGLDGHDRGALVIAEGLRDAGMEVIYTGLRQTPAQIVATALQEDVQCIGLSSLSGAHLELFPLVAELLRQEGAEDILLIGGGIIPEADIASLKAAGVAEVFGPGARIEDVAAYIQANVHVKDIGSREPFHVESIDHIGIAVSAIDISLPFYLDALGLSVGHEEIIPDQAVKAAFVQVGGTHLELLEPLNDDSPIAKFLTTRGPGIHHIAYRVEDIYRALSQARKLGYRLIDEVPRSGGNGKLVAFVHPKGTHGVLTEFCAENRSSDGAGNP